MNMEYHK